MIRVVGVYEFTVVGDGVATTIDIKLKAFASPYPFVAGQLPAAIGAVQLIDAPAPGPVGNSNLNVSGGGSQVVNGHYDYVDADNWVKTSNASVSLARISDYPAPGELAWAIKKDANVLYTAPNVPLPWDAMWSLSSFGIAPVPLVEAVAPAGKTSGGVTGELVDDLVVRLTFDTPPTESGVTVAMEGYFGRE